MKGNSKISSGPLAEEVQKSLRDTSALWVVWPPSRATLAALPRVLAGGHRGELLQLLEGPGLQEQPRRRTRRLSLGDCLSRPG